MKIYLLNGLLLLVIFSLSFSLGSQLSQTYAGYENYQPSPTLSCSPTPSPSDTPSITSDEDTPTAGVSATQTPFFPTPTEGSGGYFNDGLGCGTHSCIGTPASADNVSAPTSAPDTGRATQ